MKYAASPLKQVIVLHSLYRYKTTYISKATEHMRQVIFHFSIVVFIPRRLPPPDLAAEEQVIVVKC